VRCRFVLTRGHEAGDYQWLLRTGFGVRRTYLSHSLTTSKMLFAIFKSIQVRGFDGGLGERENACFPTVLQVCLHQRQCLLADAGGYSGVNLSDSEELG
jgi:hypothetical protein